MKTLVIIIVVLIVGYVGYYLYNQQIKIQKNAEQGSSAQIDNTVVTMKNFTFNPEVLKIAVGAEVTFRNEDSTAHTITGDNFDSGTINESDSYRHIFNEKGTFDYHCSIHQTMKGQIVVE